MTRRTTDDPLLRLFIDRYHLHLLAIPREHAAVGDVYVEARGRVSAPGRIEHLLMPAFTLPDVRRGERLADVAGQVTRHIDMSAGINLLENILAGLGLPAALSVRESLQRSSGVGFRFHDVFRDWLDVLELGMRLPDYRLARSQAAVSEQDRLHVTTAVLSTSAISLELDRTAGGELAMQLEAAVFGAANASVGIERSESITISAERRLAFGVELHELEFAGEEREPRLKRTAVPLRVRAGPRPMVRDRIVPTLIGGPRGDMFLPER
jgi:hypothetical protein